MRILSVITYYHPHWTGLATIARRINESLAARGHAITVLTTRHDTSLAREEIVRGVRVVRLTPAFFVSRGAVAPAFPFRIPALVREHDLVQIHTPLAESLLVAATCRLTHRPLLMTHYGDLVLPAGAFNRVVEGTVVRMMSAAARLADHVTTLSPDYARHSTFLRPFSAKLTATAPPVDIPAPRIDNVAAWRRTLGLDHKRTVGFAGRFVEEKGFDYLLRALPALVERCPDVHLLYAGEHRVAYERFYDRCRDLLERHKERITFVGLLRDPQQLANFYALCDVLALPSRTDCFASVQVEAMMCGTPVVASDIPGAREAVQRTGMGLLAPAGDPEGLARAILDVLADRDRFMRTREDIRSVYDAEQAISEYEALMSAMIARG